MSKKDIYETSIETIKFIATITISALGVGIVAITLYAGFTLHNERTSIEELKYDTAKAIQDQTSRLDSILMNVQKSPNVEAFSSISTKLSGQTLGGKLFTSNGNKVIIFSTILKNTGTGISDNLFIKLYSRKPLMLGTRTYSSSDEPDYDYETFTDGNSVTTKLPPGASLTFPMEVVVNDKIKKGISYPILMKVYYGAESPNISTFNLYLD